MNLKPYTPQAGSLASQVVRFFTNNADEHLTLDDITDKFDCVRGNVHTLLRPSVESGLLVRAINSDGDYIYRRGPQAAPVPSGVNIDKVHARAARPSDPSKSIRKFVDIASLKVTDDVPYMPEAARGGSKWDALFDKLQKTGQSVSIPRHCKAAVAAAALKRNKKAKGTYKVGMTSRDDARVWRVA